MDDFQVLHVRLKETREKAGMTQRQIADKIGVSTQTISTYEREKIPTLENLVAIAETLNVSVDWLLGKEPEKPQSEPEDLAEVLHMIETLESVLRTKVKIQRNEEEGFYSPEHDKEFPSTIWYDIVFPNCPRILSETLSARNELQSFNTDENTKRLILAGWEKGTLDNLRQYKRENGFQAFQAIDDEDGVLPF